MQHPDEPATALQLANECILADTKSDQFVTVFLAVLDSNQEGLLYANAGHNPAYLFQDSALAELKIRGYHSVCLMGWRDDITLVLARAR